MSKIIAYTWESGVQCVECTQHAVAAKILRQALHCGHKDVNGIHEMMTGRDGVRVRPVFNTDESPDAGLYCDTCCDEIVAPIPERFQA
jgi:hypothetical protein